MIVSEDIFSIQQIKIMVIVGNIAEKLNIYCYLVGGIVRDAVLGITGKDLDFVCDDVSLINDEIIKQVPSAKSVFLTKTTYNTQKINIFDQQIDLTEPRFERYISDSIKPIVSGGTIVDDVYRRDFTINTLYLGIRSTDWMKIYDFTEKGLVDLNKGILDTPNDPDRTFIDDPTRILRGIRFAAKYEFNFSNRVLNSIKKNIKELDRIPKEQIHLELFKGAKFSKYFQIMDEMGVLGCIFPEVILLKGLPQPKTHKFDAYLHTIHTIENLPHNYLIRIVGLLHDIGKYSTTDLDNGKYSSNGHEDESKRLSEIILRRLCFSNDEINYVCKLVESHMSLHNFSNHINQNKKISNIELKRLCRRFYHKYSQILDDLIILSRADILSDSTDPDLYLNQLNYTIKQIRLFGIVEDIVQFKLNIDGNDILQICFPNKSQKEVGKEIGKIKKNLEQLVVDSEIESDRTTLIEYLKNLKLN